MSKTELSPYHKDLLRDLVDWELFRSGMSAFERISGMSADEAVRRLGEIVTSEQRDRLLKRIERSEEFYKLPADLQEKLWGAR